MAEEECRGMRGREKRCVASRGKVIYSVVFAVLDWLLLGPEIKGV